jgi:hypothetical protein
MSRHTFPILLVIIIPSMVSDGGDHLHDTLHGYAPLPASSEFQTQAKRQARHASVVSVPGTAPCLDPFAAARYSVATAIETEWPSLPSL